MFAAVLGDLQTEVGGVYNTLLYAFDFVSEYKGVLCRRGVARRVRTL